MYLDKDEIKNSLTIDQVFNFMKEELNAEPQLINGIIICRTVCHNARGGSHKLYYYNNTKLWKCFTECGDEPFDIFDLVIRAKKTQGQELSLLEAVKLIAEFFNIVPKERDGFEKARTSLEDWKILKNYEENSSISTKKTIEFKNFDEEILKHLPRPIITPWEQEGISREVISARGICYDPVSEGIVIPHYDENGNLIGIRERTLVREEEVYGKYRPAIINGKMYSHPLGFALYNLNNSKENIKKFHKAIVFEGEKSTLLYGSYFGMENDISVAVCGSSLISHQVDLLIAAGAHELVVAFDRQYREIDDEEFIKWTKKLTQINDKYSSKIDISFVFDTEYNLGYKDSPIDCGKETFIKLFNERIIL